MNTTTNPNDYCIILAGGKGRRLWPCSRENHPKQFLDFFSTGKTLLQSTYNRISAIISPRNIYVCTNVIYESLVREQLPEVPDDNILAEPIFRNTAPSVTWATFRIIGDNPKARVVIVPSDQTVFDEQAFADNVKTGLDIAGRHDLLLSFGVKPSRPEPGYGYIQMGHETHNPNVFRVKSFTEKPDRQFAKMFMHSGEFLWNTGMFLANVSFLRESMRRLFPSVVRNENDGRKMSIAEDIAYVRNTFSQFPNLSLDYGILEKSDNVYVMRCDFGWADLGTWHAVYEGMSKGEGDNVILGPRVIMEGSHNNIVKLPDDHLAVINGLDGYIVAEKGNVLLICKKSDSSALIRKYVNEVQIRYGDEFV